jgi:cation:H+ antiporter
MPISDPLLLAAGIALLVAGGEAMVRGAATLAQQLGVSPLVVGLTVVAFGTSAPELAVNVTAALRGSAGLSFGNVIGSNLANVGLILSSAALVRPLAVQGIVITRELPMMLLASAAALVMGFDALRAETAARYDRGEGILLLLLFAVFLYYTIAETLQRRPEDPFLEQARERRIQATQRSIWTSASFLALGLAGLALGGHLTVVAALAIAQALGVAKGLIGLTIVAVGTSLPELSATIMAARKGESDLAIGNVVGSNIFNLLFVLGITATIRPVPVPPLGHVDLVAMASFGAVLLVLSVGRGISRLDAGLLLASYLGYIAWRTL